MYTFKKNAGFSKKTAYRFSRYTTLNTQGNLNILLAFGKSSFVYSEELLKKALLSVCQRLFAYALVRIAERDYHEFTRSREDALKCRGIENKPFS